MSRVVEPRFVESTSSRHWIFLQSLTTSASSVVERQVCEVGRSVSLSSCGEVESKLGPESSVRLHGRRVGWFALVFSQTVEQSTQADRSTSSGIHAYEVYNVDESISGVGSVCQWVLANCKIGHTSSVGQVAVTSRVLGSKSGWSLR